MNDVRFDPETGEVLDEDQPAAQPAPAQQAPVQPPPAKPARKKKKRVSTRIPPPADETRRQKFERLASGRFASVVQAMRVLRKLGRNQSSYEYGDADVERIRAKLQGELDETVAKLKREGAPQQVKLFD